MKRRIILPTLLAAVAAPVSGVDAAPVVVGGTATQIQSAPWAVSLRQTTKSGVLVCSGAVLDALHVLTAGHCVFDLNGAVAAPSTLSVRAGASNYTAPATGDAVQDRGVSSFRVPPGYTWSTGASADDVAILALSAPLDLSTPQVQAAPLPSEGGSYPYGAAVTLAGFGRETAGSTPDGSLNGFSGTVDEQGACGGFANRLIAYQNAIAFCASAPSAVVCNGDSGAALVTADPPHNIVGIASAGAIGCGPGSHAVYTNVEAPEILEFIRGNDRPPVAPRANATTYVHLDADAPLQAGTTLICTSGNWDGSPSITYEFVDTRTHQLLERSATGSLLLTGRTAGATIACRVMASNAGGTAALETAPTAPAAGVPQLGIERVAAIRARRGSAVHVEVWLDPAAGVTGKYGVCVTPPPRVGGRACASKRASGDGGGRFPLTVSLRIAGSAPLGAVKLAISAVAGPSRGQSTALLRVVR